MNNISNNANITKTNKKTNKTHDKTNANKYQKKNEDNT